jgi:radical SAM-linked protein
MRARVRFSKLGKVKWTSHRDVARMWERALRRAGLPVAYSEGFSPRPKLHFGLALSTGHESLAEYLDVDLRGEVELDGWRELLTPALPVGLDVMAAVPVTPGAPSLQQDVVACTWELTVPGIGIDDAEASVARVLAADVLEVERTRKGVASVDDIRADVLALRVLGEDGSGTVLAAELATTGRALRPAELLGACLPGHEPHRVLRTHQWIERDGARCEPIAPSRPARAHEPVEACA